MIGLYRGSVRSGGGGIEWSERKGEVIEVPCEVRRGEEMR